MYLVGIFCAVDDFCKQFERNQKLLTNGSGIRNRTFSLSLPEIMTILIYFHFSGYKTFKEYYEKHVLVNMKSDFRGQVSYNRFIELKQKVLVPLMLFAHHRVGSTKGTGISFIDSFPLKVCHNRRILSHKTFKGLAKRGKTSVDWFFGFKLHVVINHMGEMISFQITPGNVNDCNRNTLMKLLKNVYGKIFGDKGYVTAPEVFEELYRQGKHLITKIKKNMKNKIMIIDDKKMLKKRGVIESVGNILKAALSLEHSRHRSAYGFFGHVFSTIIAYNLRDKKPSIIRDLKAISVIA
jgi:hypothetical protein